jgi:hypothetical protein
MDKRKRQKKRGKSDYGPCSKSVYSLSLSLSTSPSAEFSSKAITGHIFQVDVVRGVSGLVRVDIFSLGLSSDDRELPRPSMGPEVNVSLAA